MKYLLSSHKFLGDIMTIGVYPFPWAKGTETVPHLPISLKVAFRNTSNSTLPETIFRLASIYFEFKMRFHENLNASTELMRQAYGNTSVSSASASSASAGATESDGSKNVDTICDKITKQMFSLHEQMKAFKTSGDIVAIEYSTKELADIPLLGVMPQYRITLGAAESKSATSKDVVA